MALSDQDRLEIRMELKGQREAIAGLAAARKETDRIGGSTGAYSKQATRGERANARFAKSFSALGRTAKYGAIGLGALAVVEVPRLINAYRESAKVGRVTNARIKSTGGIANVTASHLADLSGTLSAQIGVDDELIQTGGNMLLSFKNIRNEAGKGNDIFDQTVKTMMDVAAEMDSGPRSEAIRLGKALNDPIKGLSALSKVGIQFTEDQTKQIETLVESGKTMKAQKLILGELQSQYGGTAKAESDPFDLMMRSLENLEESMGGSLMPLFTDLANKATLEFGRVEDILNSKNLTGEQKFNQVMNIVNGIVERGIEELTAQLPRMSSVGARYGIKLAIGVGQGFLDAPILGKLFVGGLLLARMGGFGPLLKMGGKGGLIMGKAMGGRFLATVAPTFAADVAGAGLGAVLGDAMPRLRTFFSSRGRMLGAGLGAGIIIGTILAVRDPEFRKDLIYIFRDIGQAIVNALIGAVNVGIGALNDKMDELNALSFLGVDAPNIGQIGTVNVSDAMLDDTFGSGSFGAKGGPKFGIYDSPKPGQSKPSKGYRDTYGSGTRSARKLTAINPPRGVKLPRIGMGGGRGGGTKTIHIYTTLDGKVVAENTVQHVEDEAAFS